ncbi:MAG: metal ABC transporter ATP-binding protein [Candidatus Nanopelagicales bacterium]
MSSAAQGVELIAVARDLELRYGSHVALAKSTFEIPKVGVVSVIGPNGSGKSTLLSALAGLVPVASGSLRVLDTAPEQARARMSYVMQATPVPRATPITVREVVGLGRLPQRGMFGRFRASDRQAVAGAMDRMQITHLAGRHMHELSGGQRQRVLIAQGIAQDHDLLVLDEPLTGLDLTSAATIDSLIHEQRADGCTVILTTHDLDEARAADWVILVSGRVVASGPPAAVCTRGNLEVAYGLGAIHDWEGFLDDPTHGPHHH